MNGGTYDVEDLVGNVPDSEVDHHQPERVALRLVGVRPGVEIIKLFISVLTARPIKLERLSLLSLSSLVDYFYSRLGTHNKGSAKRGSMG